MTWITLRKFAWTTKSNRHGSPEVAKIRKLHGESRLTVDISDVIISCALATPANRPVLYEATLHELRLLGSYLLQDAGQRIFLHDSAFHASAGHIRSFVSESVGLGMLAATVQATYRWTAPKRMFNVDVLPASLAAIYGSRGTRPDLLFDLPHFRLAGEARGRSKRPSRNPLSEQYKRLDQLLPWGEYHNHPLIMTWTYLTKDGITVDLFRPEDGISGLDINIGEDLRAQPAPNMEEGARLKPETPEYLTKEPQSRPDISFDKTPIDQIFEMSRQHLIDIEEKLHATAPRPPGPIRVAGRTIRGRWVPIDVFGQTDGILLFAVLDEPISPAVSRDTTERMRDRANNLRSPVAYDESATPFTFTIQGRTLVALAYGRTDEPWDLIED